MTSGGPCTLATCEPAITKLIQPGDWILGTGFAQRGTSERLGYATHVEGAMTFDARWNHPLNWRKITMSAKSGEFNWALLRISAA